MTTAQTLDDDPAPTVAISTSWDNRTVMFSVAGLAEVERHDGIRLSPRTGRLSYSARSGEDVRATVTVTGPRLRKTGALGSSETSQMWDAGDPDMPPALAALLERCWPSGSPVPSTHDHEEPSDG